MSRNSTYDDGSAEEMGWSLLKEKQVGRAAIAVRKKNVNLLRHALSSTRWVLIVLESILFLSLYLPHTWGGETNLEEYYKTLKEVDRNVQDVKQKFHVSGIIAGMDVRVEVKPHQEGVRGEMERERTT